MNLLTQEKWEHFINQHPDAHILQTAAWGELKSHYGWTPRFIRVGEVGAMVLFRHLPLGFSIAYIPRGPVGDSDWIELWPAVDELCGKERALFLRVEPNLWGRIDKDDQTHLLPDFQETDQSVQPPRTILIDLKQSEEDILMDMKSKTRYNIRLAGRKEVQVRESDDVKTFHRMMATTGDRDDFGIHSLDYYQSAYELFALRNACVLLIASYQDQPLAGLMAFAYGNTSWYFYGASTNQERNRMPTYLLQWEAIRWAKNKGCQVYDLWGVPDYPESTMEETFLDRSDGLWGVYRFKRGFGGQVKRTIGTWDKVYHPLMYQLYRVWSAKRKIAAG